MALDIDTAAAGFERLVDPAAPFDRIAHGLYFGEGPVWDRRTKQLFWVDIIGNTIWKWQPGVGQEVVLRPSQHANGMTFDHEGRLNVAGWCSRSVWRFEKDGTFTTLASHYDGKKLNTPNDIVVRSDGQVYWTDSAGGLVIPGMVAEDVQRYLDFQGVYRVGKAGGPAILATDEVSYPNGLAFSPDEKLLYVNDTRQAYIRVFDVNPDGSLSNGRRFHDMTGTEGGVADGMKCDTEGNVWCTGPGGVHVIDPSGKLLGRIFVPGHHGTNFCWGGDDWRTLYMTTFTEVWRTQVKIPGIAVW